MDDRTYTWNGHTFPISRPELSDKDVAARVRMLMRDQLDHEAVCCLARDRIVCLVGELRKVTAERDEAFRRRDYWRGLAEGKDWVQGYLLTCTERDTEKARAEAAEAEVARLTAQAREDAMQLLATSGQAQDALAEVATLRDELDDAKSENASRSAMFATVCAELDAARGRVKPLVWDHIIRTGTWQAQSPFGEYSVGFDDGWWAQLEGSTCWEWDAPEDPRSFSGPYAGQLACKADYTARILAALEPDPAVVRMREALNIIAANTCCDGCQEAAHVARAALQEE